MEAWPILFGLVALIGFMASLNHRLAARRMGRDELLSGRYGIRREPGMEASDLDGFILAMSRNAPRGEVPQELQGPGCGIFASVLAPKDDETYARRYHDAFGPKQGNER
ncbi:hypothetical protein [Pseudogemmobacter bohemicus]|uniref:hypothetical protein n=1 Tax=Pseudogemmobacter bohemicus TaxID=2250708 RepID=UPI000DD46989|nr:hypothetical protein [Pseudogemmobacter bohemicus]